MYLWKDVVHVSMFRYTCIHTNVGRYVCMYLWKNDVYVSMFEYTCIHTNVFPYPA